MTRALSRARSVSMDALMTRYSMLSKAFNKRGRKISRWVADIKWRQQRSEKRTSKLKINVSNKYIC